MNKPGRKPSHAMPAVFRAAIRRLDDNDLMDLRAWCVDLGEHPVVIAAIGRERARRKGGQSLPVSRVPVCGTHAGGQRAA